MFILASTIPAMPILSIQNGHQVAEAGDLIINADKLSAEALYCVSGAWRKNNHVLLLRDVREFGRAGLIIDSLEDIEDIGEIVRLASLVEANYQPIGKTVVTESGTTLGKVEDYAIESTSYTLEKLYIKQSLIKNLLLNNLVVDRTNIVRAENDTIIVRDAVLAERAKAKTKSVAAPATPTLSAPMETKE